MNSLTIVQCLNLSSQLSSVSDTPRLDIEIFLAQILKKNRAYLFTWPEKILTDNEEKQFNHFFLRRLTGEPVAHIVGQREFWSLPILVNSSTLIPRPDTEILVEAVLNLFLDDASDRSRKILDLGTGTGAIALALAHEKKSWQLLGVDQSTDAIELAERNKTSLQLSHIQFLHSNWFSTISSQEKFDVIVSNPPYIDSYDAHLSQGDLRFEPRSALVAEKNGLADIEIICASAPKYLTLGGYLVLEHGYQQAESVRDIFEQSGFTTIKTLKDFGGNDRVTLGNQL